MAQLWFGASRSLIIKNDSVSLSMLVETLRHCNVSLSQLIGTLHNICHNICIESEFKLRTLCLFTLKSEFLAIRLLDKKKTLL